MEDLDMVKEKRRRIFLGKEKEHWVKTVFYRRSLWMNENFTQGYIRRLLPFLRYDFFDLFQKMHTMF